ncbi:MAG: ABC transporter permease [Eubacteriales bacterium]|nr:ABC transporter permease [Eubacteriales bacterium]
MSYTKKASKAIMTDYKVVIIILVLGVFLTFSSDVFLTSRNLMNVLRQVCVNAMVASAFVIVISTAGIDLSVGSIVGLVGVIVAVCLKANVPIVLSCLIGIVAGAGLGAINAFFITKFDLLPFVVTLSTQMIFRGAIYLITNMSPITGLPDEFLPLGQGYVGPVPVPVFFMIIIAVVAWFLVNRTKFGRYALAIGGNATAARVSGVDVKKYLSGCYILCGAFCGIAALVLTARTASAQTTAGVNMEMDIIAGCVIGGTPMTGGICNVYGSLLGCLLVGLVGNGMNILGVNANWQTVMKGLLILIAVLIDKVSATIYEAKKA